MNFEDSYTYAECSGLVDGLALKKATNEQVYAGDVVKEDGPFYCSECLSDAIVRKCVEKKDHFAHEARLSAVYLKGDRALHDKCRDEICAALEKMFPDGKWATERSIPENKDKELARLVPDVSGRINDKRVVIEIQASILSLKEIKRRTIQYMHRECAVLWIVPLKEPLGEEKFRPRLFERYLHTMYYGRTYYWHEGQRSLVQPVHYGPAERWIEERQWFEEDGEERSGGGYNKTYKSLKTPLYGATLDICEDFIWYPRIDYPDKKNEKKSVPECIIYKDNLDDWWKE